MRLPSPGLSCALLVLLGLPGCGDATGPDPGDPGGGDDEPVVSRVEIQPDSIPPLTWIGDTIRLVAVPTDSVGDPVPNTEIAWESRDAESATADGGLVTARGHGGTFIVARVAGVADSLRVVVDTTTLALSVEVLAPPQARQGDVIQLEAVVTWRAGGRDTLRSGIDWRLSDPNAGAVYEGSRFVPFAGGGMKEITASVGPVWGAASIELAARSLSGSFTTVGNGSIPVRNTTDLWVHDGVALTGTNYTGVPGNRLFVWDIGSPSAIALVDSVAVDAQRVNDVKIRSDGALAVLTHEGSGDGLNGITLLDLADPLHPAVITRYTGECAPTTNPSCLSQGVHNVWIEGDFVYVVEPGGGLHIVDIQDPAQPREAALFHAGTSHPHDVLVRDGLAFVSHWSAGLVILDVGNGTRGGSPDNPVEVSRILIPGSGPVHNAWYWPEGGYVFVGEESFAEPIGRLHVVDVSDLAAPVRVADFLLPDFPPHNFWLDEDSGILFAAWYGNGLRAIDVTGELLGDLARQGREYATVLDGGAVWAPQIHDGLVFASDIQTGLWAFQFTGQ